MGAEGLSEGGTFESSERLYVRLSLEEAGMDEVRFLSVRNE